MTAPVGIITYIADSGNTFQLVRGNEREEFLPHGTKIYKVLTLTGVFLCNLKFRHLIGLLHVVEDRCVWFTWLEVEWTVLALQKNVVAELSVEVFEL